MKLLIVLVMLPAFFNAGVARQFQLDSLFVRISGDTVNIWDNRAEENCYSRFRSGVTIMHDTVNWIQTDTTGPRLTCQCLFALRASIVGLPSGSYQAMVYRERLVQYGYPHDTLIFIGSISFIISSAGGSASSKFWQSGCNAGGVSVRDQESPPYSYTLENYPNPFNPATTISFTLPRRSHVRLEVFDMLGRLVEVLANDDRLAGEHSIQWRAEVASGVYHCRLTAHSHDGTCTQLRTLVLLR